jgi:cobalamin-dependent methionine synthase I
LQVKEDVYEKIDKELLEYVEDVLLNRCENATERLLEFAATLDPKSKPCKVVRKGGAPVLKLSEKVTYLLDTLMVMMQADMKHMMCSTSCTQSSDVL